jgi:DNA-binding winged helix-turn-helix (wHTH) protein
VDDSHVSSYYGATTASELVASDAPTTTGPDSATTTSATAATATEAAHRPSQSGDSDPNAGPVLVYGNLEIRPDEIQALADGRRVGLTVREFQVLCVLAQREDRVVRRADIYNQVWGGEMKHRDRSVDVFVRKVRNKLSHVAPHWSYIHTHFGVGYRFAPTPHEKGQSSHAPEAADLTVQPLTAS